MTSSSHTVHVSVCRKQVRLEQQLAMEDLCLAKAEANIEVKGVCDSNIER